MNVAVRIEPQPYDVVGPEFAYIMTEAKLEQMAADGLIIPGHINACAKPALAYFRTDTGRECEVALDVPLCGLCDSPIDHGVCHDCRTIFTGLETVQ